MSEVSLSPMAAALKSGVYVHYKGGEYKVMGVAIHSETLEELVVCQALYGNRLFWVRPLSMFSETVEIAGKSVARFQFLHK